jgi:glycosyltransferase involved in cell wall biosynthesis
MSLERPLCSAIMPTRGRGIWAWQAVQCFLRQTYEPKELVILDDIDARSFAIPPSMKNIRYLLAEQKFAIGEKRNMCCRAASGDIIMHFDDDDWSAPERMADQMERLLASGKAVTGYRSILFYSELGDTYKFIGTPNYVVGTSLAYQRAFWERNPFTRQMVGEDNQFIYDAVSAGELVAADGTAFIVARVHSQNTSQKDVSGFVQLPSTVLPQGFLMQ